MTRDLQEILTSLLGDGQVAAAQADLVSAAALARQELSFRQRAGAAAAQLRQARADGADPAEIATLEAELRKRTTRLEAAATQARAAELKRPLPDEKLAQIFGRAQGTAEKPPVTVAVLSAKGEVVAQAVASDNQTFHVTSQGDLNEVILQVSDAQGRVLYREATPVSIPAGTVFYLDVPLGTPKPPPGPVPKLPKMPELVGQHKDVAAELLRRIGTTDISFAEKAGDGPAGIVIEQSPEAGTELAPGTKIALTVRAGGAEPTKVLPNFVGGTLADAERILKELGLAPTVKREPSDGAPDIVLAQSPVEGTKLSEVSAVDLTVSVKREAPPDAVIVPELIGKPADLATELLKAAGLGAEIKETADAGAKAGVTAQDPSAGTTVKRRTAVTIIVNTPPVRGPERVVVPSLEGQDLARAQRTLEALGLKHEASTVRHSAPKGQVVGQEPVANSRVDAGSAVKLAVSAGAERVAPDRRELAALTKEMAKDPRAEEDGLTAARIAKMLEAGGIDGVEAAEALGELPPDELRDRLQLRNKTAATRFRAILRRTLKAKPT